jgi:hypothetical protein
VEKQFDLQLVSGSIFSFEFYLLPRAMLSEISVLFMVKDDVFVILIGMCTKYAERAKAQHNVSKFAISYFVFRLFRRIAERDYPIFYVCQSVCLSVCPYQKTWLPPVGFLRNFTFECF